MTSKEVVPVKELKQQVDERNRQNIGSIHVEFYEKVHTTWSKYPCDIEATCIDTHCFGRIYIQFKDDIGRLQIFQIEVMAIRNKKSTYILMDTQFHELIKCGGFTECDTVLVHY
jgi:hypothetical protein